MINSSGRFKKCHLKIQWSLETLKSETNEPLEGFSGDSIWNFHVWNDIWVRGTGHWPAEYSGNLKPKFTQRIMVPEFRKTDKQLP